MLHRNQFGKIWEFRISCNSSDSLQFTLLNKIDMYYLTSIKLFLNLDLRYIEKVHLI